jgi:hypothetical protein
MKSMSLSLNMTVEKLLTALKTSNREQRKYRAQLNAEEARKIRNRKHSDTKKIKTDI